MINSETSGSEALAHEDAALDAIMRTGARGAVLLAGLSTTLVIALWFAFYLLVFSPRAAP